MGYSVNKGGAGPLEARNTQWIYTATEKQNFAIGARLALQDDRVFRYGQADAGAAIAQGKVVGPDVSEVLVADTDDSILAPTSCVTKTDGSLGSKFIEATLASVTAGLFEGAVLSLTGGTGAGYQYAIKGNTATGDPASGNVRIELYDPRVAAVDATTDFGIVPNIYKNLIHCTHNADYIAAGIPATGVTASYYAWIQTWGRALVLCHTTAPTVGALCQVSDTTAGAVELGANETYTYIGYCTFVGDNTGYGGVYLTLGA